MKCLGLNGLNKSTHFIKRVKRVITGYSRVMFRLKGLTYLVKQSLLWFTLIEMESKGVDSNLTRQPTL
jgi:uncharacterized membrane protein